MATTRLDEPHPLLALDGRSLGRLRLRVRALEPAEKSGWVRFELAVGDEEGEFSPPVVRGIHSAGGRGVRPWIEITDYRPEVSRGAETLRLSDEGLDVALFAALLELVPPGGHLMVWCESPVHRETYLASSRGVPPVLTPLGSALHRAGLPRVKLFDLPEGGREGEKKLWADVPVDAAMARAFRMRTEEELRSFLSRPPSSSDARRFSEPARRLLRALER